jgi:hypothetical protein
MRTLAEATRGYKRRKKAPRSRGRASGTKRCRTAFRRAPVHMYKSALARSQARSAKRKGGVPALEPPPFWSLCQAQNKH